MIPSDARNTLKDKTDPTMALDTHRVRIFRGYGYDMSFEGVGRVFNCLVRRDAVRSETELSKRLGRTPKTGTKDDGYRKEVCSTYAEE